MQKNFEDILEKSIVSIKEIRNFIQKNNERLEAVYHKFYRKKKLKEELDLVIESHGESLTNKEMHRLKENKDVLEKEIKLIEKRKLKLEGNLEKYEKDILKVISKVKGIGINGNKDNILEVLLNAKYLLYLKKYIGKKEKNPITKEMYFDLVNKKYKKVYIIDTNIFIEDPRILDCITVDNLIVISKTVIEELDRNKTNFKEDVAFKAREAIRRIDCYKKENIVFSQANESLIPKGYSLKGDNLILSVAMQFKEFNPILITNDIAFNIKAKAEGINTCTLEDILS